MPPGELIAEPPSLIEIRRVDNRGRGGRGVFARRDIPAGTLIERAPVLVLRADQIFPTDGSVGAAPQLTWYVFDWRAEADDEDYVAVALGYGSLYNHRILANARWERVGADLIEFTAHRDIPAGREVTINYHGEPGDAEPVGFETHE